MPSLTTSPALRHGSSLELLGRAAANMIGCAAAISLNISRNICLFTPAQHRLISFSSASIILESARDADIAGLSRQTIITMFAVARFVDLYFRVSTSRVLGFPSVSISRVSFKLRRVHT